MIGVSKYFHMLLIQQSGMVCKTLSEHIMQINKFSSCKDSSSTRLQVLLVRIIYGLALVGHVRLKTVLNSVDSMCNSTQTATVALAVIDH